jgi:hypothetical protein
MFISHIIFWLGKEQHKVRKLKYTQKVLEGMEEKTKAQIRDKENAN